MLSVHAEMTSLLVRMETGNVRMPIEHAWMTFVHGPNDRGAKGVAERGTGA
jgi:hypothetical protein